MDMFLVSIIGGLLVAYFCVGIIASRKVKTNTDYFLAGKSLTIPTITATLLATQIGGGMFLGTAQDPFRGLLYIFGMALGFLALGLGLAAQLQSFKVTTIGEIFEKKYGSHLLRDITSLLSAASMCGIIIGQILAAKSVLLHFGGINNEMIFLAFWACIIGYTMIGGLAAVVMTDFAQVIVITISFTGICLYTWWNNPIPFFTNETYALATNMIQDSGLSWAQAFRVASMPVFFSIIEQDLAQRFFAAKTKRDAAVAALLASVILLLFGFVPFYFGMYPKLTNMLIEPGVSPLLPVLKSVTNELFFVVALCGILSAITSTTDSLLCAVSTIVASMLTSMSKSIKPSLGLSRAVTLGCGLLTLAASYFVSSNIINILVDSYEISVSCLLVPLSFCFITNDLREHAALTSAVFGFCGFLFFRFTDLPYWKPYAIIITLAIALIGYGFGYLNSKKTRKKKA